MRKLQGRTVDVITAFNDVTDCIDDMKTLRENVEGEFSIVYQQAERMAAKSWLRQSHVQLPGN